MEEIKGVTVRRRPFTLSETDRRPSLDLCTISMHGGPIQSDPPNKTEI